MTAGAVATATLTMLIWVPPQVHGKASAVWGIGQAAAHSRPTLAELAPLVLAGSRWENDRAPEASDALSLARRCALQTEVVMGWIDVGAVTWWAVGVAFLATFVFGWFYYSPQGLFPLWARLGKVSDDDVRNANMGIAFGGTFLGNALGVILLALLMAGLGVEGWAAGLGTGALIGLVFRGGAHAMHNGFAARHPGVTLLDLAHDTIALAIAGAILGAAG